MFLFRSLLQSGLHVKFYLDVSTGCLHFEIYQEDTRRVSVVWEKKKKIYDSDLWTRLSTRLCKGASSLIELQYFVLDSDEYFGEQGRRKQSESGPMPSAKTIVDRLQRVLNAVAQVVSDTRKFDRGLSTLLNDELHWLDVPERVTYKLGLMTYHCLHG